MADLSDVEDALVRLAAPFMKKLEAQGIDLRRQPIEIAPAVHYLSLIHISEPTRPY